jgi:hypothetical protein
LGDNFADIFGIDTGLDAVASLQGITQQNTAWDGVAKPWHNPAAIDGVEDVEDAH